MMKLRICRKCKLPQPADPAHFVPHPDCRDGLTHTCRACQRRYVGALRKQPLQKFKRRLEHLQSYDLVKQQAQARRRAARNPFHDRAAVMRSGLRAAVARGVPVDLELFSITTIARMLRAQVLCPCCGLPFDVQRKIDGMWNNRSPSLDRFEPSKGYVIGNVTILCWRCNNLKRDASAEELQNVVNWMRRRRRDAEAIRTMNANREVA